MRLASLLLLVPIFACLLLAQAPIGFGPGTISPGLLDVFDWYPATASGCSAAQGANGGPRGMCAGHQPSGDTIYFTGWFQDASQLPVTTGLPIVGTLNDFTMKTCSGNAAVVQLAEFDWTARNASRIYEVNCMADMNGVNSPSGWFGHCTSGDDGGNGCVWHSRQAFVRDGRLYLPIFRTPPAGSGGGLERHDMTIIRSDDGGKTWKNPYTIAHSGSASSTGDVPRCGSAAGGSGNPCTDASYPESIMWPALPYALFAWQAIQYGQDGATPPAGVNDGCAPGLYTCFIGDPLEGAIARVLNTDLPSLDVSKWQYYTCPAITDTYRCPGSASSSWTSTFADRTPTGPPRGTMWGQVVAYIKEFKSYLMVGADGGNVFATAPTIQGPWDLVTDNTSESWGFTAPMLGAGHTVEGTNPPHVKLTMVRDTSAYTSETTPFFAQWDLVLGRTPALNGGDDAIYRKISGNPAVIQLVHAGLVISDSHAPGTIPRKDLVWAFDFYDHGGHVYGPDAQGFGTYGFHDIANGSAFLAPFSPGFGWTSGRGISLQAFGVSTWDAGYGAYLATTMHETPQTIAIGAANTTTSGLTLQNAPASMQGNGTFTVAGVFRFDSAGSNQVPLWTTGDNSGTNTMVALSYPNGSGGPLELGWGVNANRWRYNSGFSLVQGNWYFIACTVQANGTTPTAHMWTGVGGALVDEIAGVSRTSTGGTPTQTPNVAATPLWMGMDTYGATHNAGASYAGLFVYGRALGRAEAGLMYNTLKAKMAARGVTLQ